MPIRKIKKGWTFGKTIYPTLKSAEKAYKAYLIAKHMKSNKRKKDHA